jgi:ferredoxin hydrogenase small subunit
MDKLKHLSRRDFVKVAGLAAGAVACGLSVPIPAEAATEADIVTQRQSSVYATDAQVYKFRKSQDNPMIQKLYDKKKGFLKEGPGGHKSHELLHTHYHDRSAGLKALKAKGVKLAI